LSGTCPIRSRLTRRELIKLARSGLLGMAAVQLSTRLASAADDDSRSSIGVVYPQIGEPYRSAFAAIVRGIEDRTGGRIVRLPLLGDASPDSLTDALRSRHVRAVIALGRSGLKATTTLDLKLPVIAAGVLSVPESEGQSSTVVSLAPDPHLLFNRLKAFVPQTRRVIVVYNPRQNDWLIRLAREAARQGGLELLAFESDDLKGSLKRYQELMGQLNVRRDALWLPQDSAAVDESAVLPWLLRTAWDEGLPVFSSNVAHVRRGALFALYPDNIELGRHLGTTAMSTLSSGSPPPRGLQALRQVLTAVNVRTARHLGLDLEASAQAIHLVLPEQ